MNRVMVVDDSLMIRVNLKKLFEKRGYTVVAEASNGQEAVEKYQQFKPDVTTLDITMPVMDGLEALKQIKGMDEKARVIMISALGQELKIAEALDHGAMQYITKPFQEEDIIRKVETVISLS